jgi:hypothetical protein
MKLLLLAMLAGSPALFGFPDPTPAQVVPCDVRERVVKRLHDSYGETLQGRGVQSSTTVIEIYASDEHGTWTILQSRVDGMSCVVAVGQGWQGAVSLVVPQGLDL